MKFEHCGLCLYLFFRLIEYGASYNLTDDRLERIYPRGFRISIPNEAQNDVRYVRFYVNIDRPLDNSDADFTALVQDTTNGRWVFDIINRNVSPNNRMYYYIGAINSVGHLLAHVQKNKVLPEDTIDISTRETCAAYSTRLMNCEPSLTTVHRKPVCKGELIFEDNFETLNSEMWKKEVRIPLENEGFPFVSFQNRPENCFVKDGQLHIVPTLLSNVPGFNEARILNGSLDLQGCTPIDDELKECSKKTQFAQILPPIVSARIQTKDSFTFRYGRVEIRAKMPKGDWVIPLILLDPLEHYYGFTRYTSGQMRVAYVRGNVFLEDKNRVDISSALLEGGPVVANQYSYIEVRLAAYYGEGQLGDDYHNYTLTWKDTYIELEIDGHKYGHITENFKRMYKLEHTKRWANKMAPFDREFFLSLGVSVGGHVDFPEGCLNGQDRRQKPWKNFHPKAEWDFWKDRNSWLKTWKGEDTGLHIDFIRVYAL